MKFADVEATAQDLMGLGKQRPDFEFAHHARQRVSGHRHEAVGHQLGIGVSCGQLRTNIVDRLRTRPALGV